MGDLRVLLLLLVTVVVMEMEKGGGVMRFVTSRRLLQIIVPSFLLL